MNIQSLHKCLSRIKEIIVIGKSAEIGDVTCHVMGVVRYSAQVRLLILQYDPAFQQQIEETEAAELYDMQDAPVNNRMRLRAKQGFDIKSPFQSVRKVFIGNSEFEVNCSESQRLNHRDWECILLLSKFLHHGWQPEGIDIQSIDMLFLTSLELDGDYSAIQAKAATPATADNLKLRFILRPDNVAYMVEQPVTLTVGRGYPDKLYFRDAIAGTEHWALINNVYLSDMWSEMEKTFNNPKLKEQMTPEQIVRAKSDFEKHFSQICPKGKCFPVVEYECEDDISLQFYTKAWLDATPPVNRNGASAIGFISRPEQPTGILGLKLKTAIIHEPVKAQTTSIEAELFQYNHTSTSDDIIFK